MNTQVLLIFGVNIISLILIVVAFYFNAKRYNNIFDLPTTVISKKVKNNNLKKLSDNRYAFYVLGALNLLNLFLPNGLFKFIVPGITVVVITNILISLFEEIDSFNVTAGEINIISDFKTKQREDVKNRAKKREKKERN